MGGYNDTGSSVYSTSVSLSALTTGLNSSTRKGQISIWRRYLDYRLPTPLHSTLHQCSGSLLAVGGNEDHNYCMSDIYIGRLIPISI